jgi:hypothetical protein
MELKDVNKIQGANKLVRQWNSVKNAETVPSRIVIQAQGVGHMNANMAVMESDPEFADLWALFKAVVDRKYEAQVTVLEEADIVSPDVNASVRAAVRAKLGK